MIENSIQETKWSEPLDNHIEGLTKLGRVCIRLERKTNKPVSTYTKWGQDWLKYPCEEGCTVDEAKAWIETLVKNHIAAKQLVEIQS